MLLSFGILIFLVLLTNLQNSGCLLYPVNFTCLGELPWAISEEELKQMSTHYENWAKAGAGPGFRVMDAETYIQNFNWVGNWMKLYFHTLFLTRLKIAERYYTKHNSKLILTVSKNRA